MRLNIVSRSAGRTKVLGAGKVLRNTLKGLAGIDVEVRLNEPIADHHYNWIHDAPEGIIEAGFASRPVLVGPNTATTPADLPRFRPPLHPSSIYLFPSEWPMKAWKAMGFNECRCRVWAAGIDLDDFPARRRKPADDNLVLIYFKHRSAELLSRIEALVRECGWRYEIVRYGSYHETQYKAALARAKCGVWVGGTESQGFALMEALASGLPLLVIEASSLADNVHDPRDPLVPRFPPRFVASGAAAAPYFDPRCGSRVAANELDRTVLERFFAGIESLTPSSFVGEGFSLEQCARRLVDLAGELPDVSPRSPALGSVAARILRYFDLAARPWPWKLAGRRLMQRIS